MPRQTDGDARYRSPAAPYLDNRAENSHQPTREREKRMRRFKSAGHAQRFVEVHGIIASHFRPRRHLLSAADTDDSEANDSESGMRSRRRLLLRERCRVFGFSQAGTIRP